MGWMGRSCMIRLRFVRFLSDRCEVGECYRKRSVGRAYFPSELVGWSVVIGIMWRKDVSSST
jgi:hypothetical protein